MQYKYGQFGWTIQDKIPLKPLLHVPIKSAMYMLLIYTCIYYAVFNKYT